MEWRLPVVNVQWLNDLILGDLTALKLPLQPRYAMLSNDLGFSVDMQRVMHLLGKSHVLLKCLCMGVSVCLCLYACVCLYLCLYVCFCMSVPVSLSICLCLYLYVSFCMFVCISV